LNKTLAIALSLSLVSVVALPSQVHATLLAPSNVSADSTSPANAPLNQATMLVQWDKVAGALTYAVSATSAGQETRAGQGLVCISNRCRATVSGLSGGSSYSFVVTAIDELNNQLSAPAVTETAESIPDGPVALAPALSGKVAKLSWAAPTITGGLPLTGYRITQLEGMGGLIGLGGSQNIADPTTLFFDVALAELTPGQNYVFGIQARNSLGLSSQTRFASFALLTPDEPLSVSAVSQGGKVTVTWSAPDSPSPITGYRVYLVDSQLPRDVGQFYPAGLNAVSLVIPGVGSGSYRAQVLATNASGAGPRSDYSSVFEVDSGTLANTPVINPRTLNSLGIGESVLVSGSAPSGGPVSLSVDSPTGACTLVSGTLTAVSNGDCILNASVGGTATFAPGTSSREIVIKLAQTINFAPISGQSMPGPFTLQAFSSVNLPIQFSATGSCSVAGTELTFIAAGGCSVTASQPGNAVFSSAPPVTRSFVISSGGGFGNPNLAPPGTGLTAPKASKVFTTKKVGPAKAVVLTKPKTRVSIKVGEAVRVRLTGLPPGARVSSVLRTKAGFEYFLSAAIVKANGKYRTPAVQPRKAGVYRIVTTIGTDKKTLRIRVR
jgi:hypothetical protein